MKRRRLLALVPLAIFLAACDSASPESTSEAVQQRLIGTWLRDYEEQGTRVRRILVLQADGKFREESSMVTPGAELPQASQGSGEWVFDGTNLKRRYTLINGKPVSAPTVPFATFEIRFSSRTQFIGLDRVRKFEVVYERVSEGTLP